MLFLDSGIHAKTQGKLLTIRVGVMSEGLHNASVSNAYTNLYKAIIHLYLSHHGTSSSANSYSDKSRTDVMLGFTTTALFAIPIFSQNRVCTTS
jgi:hypothetical protein